MPTTVADDLSTLNQLRAAAGLGATTLNGDSSVAAYLSALDAVFGVVKQQMDAAVQAAAAADALLGTNSAAQIQAQENQVITLYQSALASLGGAAPTVSLTTALASAPAPAPVPVPVPLPVTSDVAPLPYSGDGVRIFGDTPMLLRETDYTVPAAAAFTRVGSGATFASPEISTDWTRVGTLTYPNASAAATIAYEAFIDAAKQLVGEAVKDHPLGSVAVAASDVRDVGNAMNGTLSGTIQLMSDLTKVLNQTMTEADWIAKQQSWLEQQKTKYDGMAAASLAGKIPGVGWILSPIVDKMHQVSMEVQTTNSYELRATLDTLVAGGPKSNVVIAGSQHNTIQLGNGHSAAAGGDGGNLFKVGIGDDIIIGGKGLDVVALLATRSDYTLTRNADGTMAVHTAKTGVAGTDTVINVERLLFSDGTLALDTHAGQVAGEAYRIYQAAFNRTPDMAGLKYWIGVMDGGAGLSDIAAGFIDSAEFRGAYGANPTNADLVTKFYQNVLGRLPEAAGFDYWLGVLNQGGAHNEVLAAFAESAENQARVVGVIDAGIWLG